METLNIKNMVLQVWKTKEWKENREQFLKENPFCFFHGEPVKATQVHHPQKRSKQTDEEYLSLKGCLALCKPCHFALSKGLRLCPKCKIHYFRKRKWKKGCWECYKKSQH